MFLPSKKASSRLQFAPIFVVCYCSTQFVPIITFVDNVHIYGYFNPILCLFLFTLVTIFMSDLLYVNYLVIFADIGAFRFISLHFVLFRP